MNGGELSVARFDYQTVDGSILDPGYTVGHHQLIGGLKLDGVSAHPFTVPRSQGPVSMAMHSCTMQLTLHAKLPST